MQPQALDRVGVSNSTRRYLKCLQKLCGVSGVLPRSFALGGELEGVGEDPFDRGGNSEVYMAIYKGQAVVVKALKLDAVRDLSLARKVRIRSSTRSQPLLISRSTK